MAKKKVKSKCAAKMKKSFAAGMSIGRNMKKPKGKKKKK
tara:strand:+ start:11482 stop:11598 length:117 start_codon:yes stop_codon:yes gene_type:complete